MHISYPLPFVDVPDEKPFTNTHDRKYIELLTLHVVTIISMIPINQPNILKQCLYADREL